MNEITLVHMKVKFLDSRATVPKYYSPGSSCMDLPALEDTIFKEGQRRRVRTGIAIELPEGYEAQVRPRSGFTDLGLHVFFATIDNDYRGEIGIQVVNGTGNQMTVKAGERIAQLAIVPIARASVVSVVEELSPTERGTKGFGSTGR